MILYLVRHGESQANVERVFSNGKIDLPLTARGRAEAVALARWLAGRGVAHVYSAPLRRAQETAGVVAAHLGLPTTVLADLDEVRVGDLDGLRDDASWARFDAVIARWRAEERGAAFEGGESYGQAYDRYAAVLGEIARRHADGERVAVAVTHGAIQLTVLPRLCPDLGLRFDGGQIPWALAHTAVNTIEIDDASGALRCLEWATVAEVTA